MNNGANKIRLVQLGIDTLYEFIIYVHSNCGVCKSEGFETETHVLVSDNGHSIIATLNVIQSNILKNDTSNSKRRPNTSIEKGQVFYQIHVESKDELEYAINFANSMPNIIKINRELV